MTFLAIDIGNSYTKIGSVQDDRRKDFFFKFRTQNLFTEEESVEEELLLNLASIEKGFFFGIASVVPEAEEALSMLLRRTYPQSIVHRIIHSEIPIVNKYRDPDQVGVDRLLASLGAYKRFQKNLIVISFGTATTIDCVSREGEFLGGVIAPGVRMGAEALASRTALLPEVPLEFPPKVLGQTTAQSIQSGVMYGSIAMVEGLVTKLKREVFPGKKVLVFATGGDATLELVKKISGNEYLPYLVMEGIVETIAKIYGSV